MSQLLGCAAQRTVQVPELTGIVIEPRSAWQAGVPDSLLQPHKIKHITLHHSGVVFTGERSTERYLQDLQAWSRAERAWPDVPYHFLIDLQGRVWEGRPVQFRGDTNTNYDPTGHALVSVIGNYEEQDLSDAQFQAVAKLVAALCRAYQLDPARVKSHKDYVSDTLCPGENLYKHLQSGALINRIGQHLQ